MDEQKALDGYHRALEIESELSAFHYENNKKQDMREFVCSARGVALMNAACLAVKKYAYGCGKLTAMENSELAVKIENWFDSYTTLWRARNRESELYRIREKFVCLCRALREWK